MSRARSKERWQLTEEALTCLLKTLHADAQAAGERYGRLQQRLTFFFMRHCCVAPEDLADEVINRLANLLLEARAIENIEAFSLGVARMVLLEDRARTRQAERTYQEVARNISHPGHTSIENETKLETMEAHLAELTPSVQQLLAEYHNASGAARMEGRQRLAAKLGISMGALRKRIFDLQLSLRLKLAKTIQTTAIATKAKEKPHL